jgi:hypothetical protein
MVVKKMVVYFWLLFACVKEGDAFVCLYFLDV